MQGFEGLEIPPRQVNAEDGHRRVGRLKNLENRVQHNIGNGMSLIFLFDAIEWQQVAINAESQEWGGPEYYIMEYDDGEAYFPSNDEMIEMVQKDAELVLEENNGANGTAALEFLLSFVNYQKLNKLLRDKVIY